MTACTVGPKYQRPKVQTPTVYRGVADPSAQPDPQTLADTKWFDVFSDEKLRELIRTALVSNYDLREAVARIDEARANYGITRADQFPTIDGSGDITTERISRGGSVRLPEVVKRDRTFGSVLLNLLTFEVDVWGRLRKATEAARADLLASEETRKAVVITLVSDVATAYFNLRELDFELEIAKRTLTSRLESLRIIKLRQERGVSNMLEVRQAEELVYSATEVIPAKEQAIEQQENFLSFLLARNPAAVERGSSLTEQQMPPRVPPGLASELIERRPDIRAAEQNLVSANALIGVAKAAYFPRITLTWFSWV
jgi:multidrug efflux system outer membrane protein